MEEKTEYITNKKLLSEYTDYNKLHITHHPPKISGE